jgi:glycosyltransferase involved in cell wall biosynthesis
MEKIEIPFISSYVIITPAFNEAAYISRTIESVLAQMVKPSLWVIVDDGSTDKTAEIINRYAAEHPWILYVRRSKDLLQSYYSSNVYAIYEGIKHLQNREYDFLAILDADISLLPDYYERILKRMNFDEKLGVASGVYMDRIGDNKFKKILNDRRSTPKALMVFRKQCYEDVGGFIAMKYGGEDTCACFAARMRGWKTWSFPDVIAIHNKPVGMGHSKNILKIRFRQGVGEYFLATHPLFLLLKSLRRCIKESPVFIGGLVRIAGFMCAIFIKDKRQISEEMVKFIRKEQWYRIVHGNRITTSNRIQVENGYCTKENCK